MEHGSVGMSRPDSNRPAVYSTWHQPVGHQLHDVPARVVARGLDSPDPRPTYGHPRSRNASRAAGSQVPVLTRDILKGQVRGHVVVDMNAA